MAIAYYCGGYVSGRMSRFDGGRQGFGTWAIGLIVTIVLAVAGVVFGSEVQRAREAEPAAHPDRRGHAHDGRRSSRSLAVVIATLLAAMGGGKAGERYHRKIDRLAYRD